MHLNVPQYIYLKITNACQLKCKHCFNANADINEHPDLQSIIQFLINYITPANIVFHGGEPLLRADIINNILKHMPKRHTTHITTNLAMPLTITMQQALLNIDYVTISFDPKIRFTSIIELNNWYHNLKWLQERHKPIRLSICFTKELLKIPPLRLYSFLHCLHISAVRFEYLSSTKHSSFLQRPNNKCISAWYRQFCNINHDIQDDFKNEASSHYIFSRYMKCSTDMLTILPDNTISICPLLHRNKIIGTIYESIDKLLEKRKQHMCKVPQQCLSCEHCKYCLHSCSSYKWADQKCPFPSFLFNKEYRDAKKSLCFINTAANQNIY